MTAAVKCYDCGDKIAGRAYCDECVELAIAEAEEPVVEDRYVDSREVADRLREWAADNRAELGARSFDFIEHVATCMSTDLVFSRRAVA